MYNEYDINTIVGLILYVSYLVVDKHFSSGVGVRQPGDGLGGKRIPPQLRVVPGRLVDAREAGGGTFTRRRLLGLHDGRRCHGRRTCLFQISRIPPVPSVVFATKLRAFFFFSPVASPRKLHSTAGLIFTF